MSTVRISPAMSAVAPLAGSVDRNVHVLDAAAVDDESLPSRGAWIEMGLDGILQAGKTVAPLAGSVDRNLSER